MHCDSVWRSVTLDSQQGRQVEGLQGKGLIWRKVAFHFPPLFVRSVLGSGAWRFQRDLGGMKSPILGPGFGNGQETDCTGVCRPLHRVRTRVLGSTPQIGVRWASPRRDQSSGLHPGR
ncbi:unnamed protein product [Staurois parvus]|uniref:Uncharacterized protein n=1 Tax=Staurois parvus TaxID=386267 RepID=A0ABN9EMU8_9NEOB|nr:unnamed protein product [Staurois parvus]